MNMVEPIYEALNTNNMQLLFDTLKVKRYPINKKSEKQQWKELHEQLSLSRSQKSIDVLKTVFNSNLIPIPQSIQGYYELYYSAPETMYSNTNIKDFLDLDYAQFLAAIHFLYPESEFSTEHGVKGEEYDNVVFVVSRGWNQYQFEKYAPMIKMDIQQIKKPHLLETEIYFMYVALVLKRDCFYLLLFLLMIRFIIF